MSVEYVNPKILNPHPEREYFKTIPDINSGTYLRIRESMEQRGIEHPVKVQSKSNHLIIAGHTRTEIAIELGMEQVPVVYVEVDDHTARNMMIQDNFERALDELDLIKIARVLKSYYEVYGFDHGGKRSSGTGYRLKTTGEIAEMFDMGERQFRKYVRLLDLIEPLQELVSRRLMGVKAGSLIAGLDTQRQQAFYESVKPNLSTPGYTVSETLAKSYRDNCSIDEEKEEENAWMIKLDDGISEPSTEPVQESEMDISLDFSSDDFLKQSIRPSSVAQSFEEIDEIDTKYQMESSLEPNPVDRKKQAEIIRTGQAFEDQGERLSFFKRAAKSKLEQLERTLLREESELPSALTPPVVEGDDEEIENSLQRIALILERFHAKVDSIAARKLKI